ncbi:hypothetical protein [Candidatus Electronema sp. JM]|uniref:hypothetical protein n=1 Tax=Candidatus Electronema sp. JM TaxID=3401571 RepID=UPI003AA9BD50
MMQTLSSRARAGTRRFSCIHYNRFDDSVQPENKKSRPVLAGKKWTTREKLFWLISFCGKIQPRLSENYARWAKKYLWKTKSQELLRSRRLPKRIRIRKQH